MCRSVSSRAAPKDAEAVMVSCGCASWWNLQPTEPLLYRLTHQNSMRAPKIAASRCSTQQSVTSPWLLSSSSCWLPVPCFHMGSICSPLPTAQLQGPRPILPGDQVEVCAPASTSARSRSTSSSWHCSRASFSASAARSWSSFRRSSEICWRSCCIFLSSSLYSRCCLSMAFSACATDWFRACFISSRDSSMEPSMPTLALRPGAGSWLLVEVREARERRPPSFAAAATRPRRISTVSSSRKPPYCSTESMSRRG
mmetsp:Transcript_83633/g.259716  ORF Transcript_83633/g.259716 Transcript_83633/m.259716 type:complete len:255 (+) Transcript_83633:461-1225(+)